MSRAHLATLTLTALVACSAPDAPVAILSPSAPLQAKPGKTVTPLAVTILDTDANGVPYRVQSDGRGEYVDGLQGMLAEIDDVGNLQITPQSGTGTTPAQRQIRFDFSAPVDPNNAYRPDTSGQLNFKFGSNLNLTSAPRIELLGVNGNPSAACYSLYIAQLNATNRHQERFNIAADPGSTHVRITRTSITPATWSVTSDSALCSVNTDVAALYNLETVRKQSQWVFKGYDYQNFALVLRAL